MKATGIVRRIDDLGRVIIPKEIRRTLRIREGDLLEIFLDRDGGVIFKKYSVLGDMSELGAGIFSALKSAGFSSVVFYDRDKPVLGVARRGMPDEVPASWYDFHDSGRVYDDEDGNHVTPLYLDGEHIGFIAVRENIGKNNDDTLRFAASALMRTLGE
jgi:AbrB family transcriptional regulator (stage V sporulation protein T)